MAKQIVWFQQINLWLLIVFLGLLPLVFNPLARIPYELPKVWFVIILAWAQAIIVLGFLFQRRFILSRFEVFLPAFWFLAVVIVTSALGIDPAKSLWGNPYRLDGLMTLGSVVAISFFVSQWIKVEHLKNLSWAVVVGAVLVSVLAIVEKTIGSYFGFVSGSWAGGAVGSTFGQPNFLAGYLVSCLPLMLNLRSSYKSGLFRLVLGSSLVCVLVASYLTQSRAGMGFSLFVLLIWPIIVRAKPRTLEKYFAVSFLLFSLVVILGGFVTYSEFRPDSRVRIYRQMFVGWWQRPMGYGIANADYAFDSNSWPMKFNDDIVVDKAHHSLLEILVIAGIPGLGLWLYFLWRVNKGFAQIQTQDQALKAWWLASLLPLLYAQVNVTSIALEVVLWIGVGISWGCKASGETKPTKRSQTNPPHHLCLHRPKGCRLALVT